MALFGLFGRKDDPAAIKRLVDKATKKYGPPENRQEALEALRDLGTPEALTGLLQRFSLRVEPGITDDEEKEFVHQVLVDAGDKAVEPVKKFITRALQPTWAIKVLSQLVPQEDLVATVIAALEREGAEYTRDPEKKIVLLDHLEPLDDPRIAPALAPFFADMNEDVRVKAVRALGKRCDEACREPLVQALLKAREDKSERMRKAAADALAATGLSVKGFTPSVEAALPPGYVVGKDGVVVAK